MILGIDHLGIAPSDNEQARHFFGTVLGLENLGEETVAEQKTHVAMYLSQSSGSPSPCAPTRLELLEPTDPTSPIAKFLASKKSGIHHIALRVRSISTTLDHLKSHSIKLIDQQPRDGADGKKIAFVHPHATGGILVELVEDP